jgi:hypothetical protein
LTKFNWALANAQRALGPRRWRCPALAGFGPDREPLQSETHTAAITHEVVAA